MGEAILARTASNLVGGDHFLVEGQFPTYDSTHTLELPNNFKNKSGGTIRAFGCTYFGGQFGAYLSVCDSKFGNENGYAGHQVIDSITETDETITLNFGASFPVGSSSKRHTYWFFLVKE